MSAAPMLRVCCGCGLAFIPTGKGYRCPSCRSEYEREWRERRKTQGQPVKSARMPRSYHRAYDAAYFAEERNRQRRNANMRAYREAPATRGHHKAREELRRAVASGRLIRQPCEVCGAPRADAHHDDYARPLDVRWLCRPHHAEHHAKAEGQS